MRCACRACRFDKCVAVGMNPKAIQCNRTGRIASPQEAVPSTTSSNSSSESEIPHHHASTSNSSEKELNHLFPQSKDSSRKRSSASPDSESTSKRAYTISALLDFPNSGAMPGADENSRRPQLSLSPSSRSEVTFGVRESIKKECLISEKHERLISQLVRAQENISEMLDSKDCDGSISMLDLLARPPVTAATPEAHKCDYKPQNYSNNGPAAVLNQKLAVAVEYAKTFDFFQWMPVQDKVVLLRDVAFVLLLLETAYERSSSKSASVLNHKNQKQPSQSDEENVGMSVIIESLNRAKLDKKEFLLLKAVTFLHSGKPAQELQRVHVREILKPCQRPQM
ncbi:unnamed protein product [Gongylonema pulchrum]|uniref:NR LBD domain-containing protein n=1 Tax=Gongylonema pulchrum TaxID=637853 RepID=A0A183DSU5_9BILA|nr:unnamed protein product [Gongylonema pulchrum]